MPVQLSAESRTGLGKQSNKQLRKSGRLPAVLYGQGLSGSLPITLDLKTSDSLIKANGKSASYALSLEGKVYETRIKEVQLEPLRKGVLHVDFFIAGGGA